MRGSMGFSAMTDVTPGLILSVAVYDGLMRS